MVNMCCKTKGNADPKNKPRVYFTCHPEDLEWCLDALCRDLFGAHDCAVYYTEDMGAPIPEEDQALDLGRNHLFVIPVTRKLLSTPNRAMDEDFRYALREHIPVLPVLMERGLAPLYAQPNKFGELQYLDRCSTDTTQIAYTDKLKKYLEETLHSREDLDKIRAEFSARIFLSYRKIDRRYANALLRVIHSHEQLRDVAVWFDEFLPLGENFRGSIDKALSDSDVFVLLVTPNVLEEGNFVIEEEYPAARRAGIPIIPVEVLPTDGAALLKEFEGLPECLNAKDEEIVCDRILKELNIGNAPINNFYTRHEYLIGLAYLDGIDVEVDRERGLELITSAAGKFWPDAMDRLFEMYSRGLGVKLDYQEALVWATKRCLFHTSAYGEEDPRTLRRLGELSNTFDNLGDGRNAARIKEHVYQLQCRNLGEEHPDSIITLHNLAVAYTSSGDYRKALEILRKVYDLQRKLCGLEHEKTIDAMSSLAVGYNHVGEHKKALALQESVYDMRCRIFGEEHPIIIDSMNNLALTHHKLGNYQKALDIGKKAYDLQCRIRSEKEPHSIIMLHSLAVLYGELGEQRKALELNEKVYDLRCEVLGQQHPDTLISLNNLAANYDELGNYRKAFDLLQDAYHRYSQLMGEDHPLTRTIYNNMAIMQRRLIRNPQRDEKREHANRCRELRSQVEAYRNVGQPQKELEATQKLYDLLCEDPGEENAETLCTLQELAVVHRELGDHQKALELAEKGYEIRLRLLGGAHPDTRAAAKLLISLYKKLGYRQKASALQKKDRTEGFRTSVLGRLFGRKS